MISKNGFVWSMFRCYTVEEDDHYVAICIDLNICAQAKTAKDAERKCKELIIDYIGYVYTKYLDRIDEFIPRYAPDEFLEEYNKIKNEV